LLNFAFALYSIVSPINACLCPLLGEMTIYNGDVNPADIFILDTSLFTLTDLSDFV